MANLLLWIGRTAGIVGAFTMCRGRHSAAQCPLLVGGFQIGTLLQAGIAAMVAGWLCFLAVLIDRSKSAR